MDDWPELHNDPRDWREREYFPGIDSQIDDDDEDQADELVSPLDG